MKYIEPHLSDEKLSSKISVLKNTSIKDTIKIMNSTALQVALVINKKKYIGIITDWNGEMKFSRGDVLVCANKNLHKHFLKEIKKK